MKFVILMLMVLFQLGCMYPLALNPDPIDNIVNNSKDVQSDAEKREKIKKSQIMDDEHNIYILNLNMNIELLSIDYQFINYYDKFSSALKQGAFSINYLSQMTSDGTRYKLKLTDKNTNSFLKVNKYDFTDLMKNNNFANLTEINSGCNDQELSELKNQISSQISMPENTNKKFLFVCGTQTSDLMFTESDYAIYKNVQYVRSLDPSDFTMRFIVTGTLFLYGENSITIFNDFDRLEKEYYEKGQDNLIVSTFFLKKFPFNIKNNLGPGKLVFNFGRIGNMSADQESRYKDYYEKIK